MKTLSFSESFKYTFMLFTSRLRKSATDPMPIFSTYQLHTIALFFVFLISRKFQFVNTIGHHGNMIVEFVFIFFIYVIDFWKMCKNKNAMIIDFAQALKQGIALIIPLLAMFHFADYFNFFKMNIWVHDIFMGVALFLLYNWLINFQTIHGSTFCGQLDQSDIKEIYMQIYHDPLVQHEIQQNLDEQLTKVQELTGTENS